MRAQLELSHKVALGDGVQGVVFDRRQLGDGDAEAGGSGGDDAARGGEQDRALACGVGDVAVLAYLDEAEGDRGVDADNHGEEHGYQSERARCKLEARLKRCRLGLQCVLLCQVGLDDLDDLAVELGEPADTRDGELKTVS